VRVNERRRGVNIAVQYNGGSVDGTQRRHPRRMATRPARARDGGTARGCAAKLPILVRISQRRARRAGHAGPGAARTARLGSPGASQPTA